MILPTPVHFPPCALLNSIRTCLYSVRARLYYVRARSVYFRAQFVSVCACRTDVHARKLRVHAQRSTVRALEHPVRTGINAFAPEGSRETTTTCARGTISLRPFAVHNV
jgi:hypothetical protein